MQAACAFSRSESRPSSSVLCERVRRAKDSALAEEMGKDDSWVRKVRNGECGVLLDDIPKLLAAVGLRAVDSGKVCIDRDVANAMAILYAKLAPKVPSLIWEDEEK